MRSLLCVLFIGMLFQQSGEHDYLNSINAIKCFVVDFYIVFWTFYYLWFKSLESITVMSVDLGSEWMKIAIVKPGVPMEIVLNK